MPRLWLALGLVLAVMSFSNRAWVFANADIQPFGVAHWDDTIVDLVGKLNGLEQVKTVSLIDEHLGTIDLSGLRTRAAIVAKLTPYFAASQTQYKVVQDNKRVFTDTVIVAANPVYLMDVAFSLHIAYRPAPHWLVEHPERVLTLRGPQGDAYLALRMMHVVVTKDAASMLSVETLQRLKAEMAAKYQACAEFRADDEEMFARDAAGKAFLARWKADDALRDIYPRYTGSSVIQYRNR